MLSQPRTRTAACAYLRCVPSPSEFSCSNMEPFSARDLYTLRHTAEGEQKLQRLLSAEACRLESLLISQLSGTSTWDLGTPSALAPWNWTTPTVEDLLFEEHVRLSLGQLTGGNDALTPSCSDISELSCASPPLDSPDATNATTHKRSGGAEEGILDVRMCGERRLFAQVTLFASGFVIGPKGKSIRKIEILSRCRISSSVIENESDRKIRLFCIDGDKEAREKAFRIVAMAVARYKALCDSTLARTKVEHVQHIEGVKFYYYPPPKSRGQGAKETVNLPSVTTGSI